MHPKLEPYLENQTVVLASKSAQRIGILEKELGIKYFKITPSHFAESLDKDKYAPFEYCVQTAIRKALDVYQSQVMLEDAPDLLLAADTVIADGGLIVEKPRDTAHHIAMLQRLRDHAQPHRVYTGVVAIVPFEKPIIPGYAMESYLGESEVYFRKDITDKEIQDYVASGEGSDAAGGYKVQGEGRKLIERIEGDEFNVIGLPVEGTIDLIERTFQCALDLDSASDSSDANDM